MPEFNPYAAPRSMESPLTPVLVEPAQGVWQQGNLLVMEIGAVLPPICVKTNTPVAGARVKRILHWHEPWIYATFFFCGLLYLLLAAGMRKKAAVMVPLSEAWKRRRRRGITVGWGCAIVGLLLIFGGPMAASNTKSDGWYLLIPVGLLILLVGALYGSVAARVIWAARIDDQYAWIKGVHPDLLATLPEFPGWA